MASSRMTSALAPLLRRSVVASRSASALQRGGGTPPMPPFQRIPQPTEPLVENNDAIWDDGVAPELALDFDMPHMSSREALGTWMLGFGTFFLFFQFLKLVKDPDTENPALPHSSMCVGEDHGRVGEAKPNN